MNGTWHCVAIADKPAEVYEPAGAAGPRFGILFLHGADLETLRGKSAFTALFDELGLACVCPHGGWCWWLDRVCPDFDAQLTPERYVLDRVVPFFESRWGMGARKIGLLGIGMGGQGALRLAFRYPDRFPAVAAISAMIEYHELYGRGSVLDQMYESKEQSRQDTAIMHISPLGAPPHIFFCIDPDDVPWSRGNERLREKLRALGIAHEADLTTRAGGQSWNYYAHMAGRAVRFLDRALLQESRKLL